MMPLQTIILLTTGFFLPPILAIAPAAQTADGPVIVKIRVDAQSADAAADLGKITLLHDVLVSKLHDVLVSKNIEAGGPWLGIQFGPVSKPLAAHLGIDPAEGQMVLNVVEGSPADDAGLQQYDVITKIDGNATSADVAGFLDVVRGFEPGQTHDFALVRNGNNTQVSITVGTRPESTGPSPFKFDMQLAPLSQGRVFQRGGILQKGPDGAWSFQALDQLHDLPDNVFKFMPKLGDGDMTFSWKGDGNDAKCFQFLFHGESNLQVERGEDGQITVTKTEDDNGNETTSTTTYANEEEFEAADPDGFKTYKGNIHFRVLGDLNLPGLHFGGKGAFGNFIFKKGDGDLDLDIDIDRIIEQSKEMLGHHKIILKKRLGSSGDATVKAFIFKSKPSVSFEVDPDGAIRVTIRQGDDELIENYDNSAQLEEARPELYEKYQNLEQAKPE